MAGLASPTVGIIGMQILVTIKDQSGNVVDISGSTSRFIYIKDPRNRWSKKTASLVGGGTTGQMAYTTLTAADLPLPGTYQLQARVLGAGYDYPSSKGEMVVEGNVY